MSSYFSAGLAYAALTASVWIAVVVLQRRYFHPLSKVPGPFFASITDGYVWYYNGIKGGQLFRQIERLHDIYGPVVRTGPNEVHLSNPDHLDRIYAIGSKFYKDHAFYAAWGDVLVGIGPNEVHRRRRGPINNFFSRKSVLEVEEIVQAKANKLCDRVQGALERSEAIDVSAGVRALTVDIITEYALDDCWNHLDRNDFGIFFSNMVEGAQGMLVTSQLFPVLNHLQALPASVARQMSATTGSWLDCLEVRLQ